MISRSSSFRFDFEFEFEYQKSTSATPELVAVITIWCLADVVLQSYPLFFAGESNKRNSLLEQTLFRCYLLIDWDLMLLTHSFHIVLSIVSLFVECISCAVHLMVSSLALMHRDFLRHENT